MSDTPAANPRVLVIVPAYNEADAIERVVNSLHAQLPGVDVLVVDDGSTDATAQRVPRTAACISLPFNLGIGGAMQTGYRYADLHDYDVAVQCDGDGQHPVERVPDLVARLAADEADMVIGSRFLEPGGYEQTAARAAGIAVLRSLLKVLTGKTFTDCTSGFRAVNRRVIHAFSHWYPEDYPEPEVVLLLHRAGFRILDLPVTMRQRETGRTSIPLMRGVFYVIKVAVSLVLDMARDPWPKDKVNRT